MEGSTTTLRVVQRLPFVLLGDDALAPMT